MPRSLVDTTAVVWKGPAGELPAGHHHEAGFSVPLPVALSASFKRYEPDCAVEYGLEAWLGGASAAAALAATSGTGDRVRCRR